MLRKIEISYRTVIFVTVFIAFLWFLVQIRQILLGVFISVILMSSLNPIVRKLESWKLPRWLAITLIYLSFFIVFGFALSGIIPPLIDQTSSLIAETPGFFKQFNFLGIDEKAIASQLSDLTSVPANLFKFISGIFSNIFDLLALGVITFYLLLERKNLDHYLTVLFGEEKEKDIEKVINKIEARLGGWVRGELFLMLIVGVISYIGFRIIGLEFALPLAILSFLLEVIPNVGPTVAALPAVLLGLTLSPYHALATAGWCILVQQLENTIFVPRVMKKAAGVNPLVSILALAIGFKLGGIGGAILAIPSFIALEVIVSEVFSSK